MTIDLKKDLPGLYRPSGREFVEVVVPPMRYLSVSGHGDPNTSPLYRAALEQLYPAAYAVRKRFRARTGEVFVVGPLEGLWWADDPADFVARRKDNWRWQMLIPLPAQVVESDLAGVDVDVALIDEGRCLQIMHTGPYDDEGPTLARLHAEVMPRLGVTFNGPHHEIYLGDPRRSAPERLRTDCVSPCAVSNRG
ncbi:GyrI-like domain-containing protein [Corynebacterium sp.]|uniref:GyrI-like domain-containing protein n=1 Tax=Corynebacterium sp. TaxID=1720 RepID=UPI0026E0899A|nr:GyrI-like domain-containing protein [Corynebacterium sp.]MDO5512993.1 GyrI-like domain-containing protein [Corynebacterium sp.]